MAEEDNVVHVDVLESEGRPVKQMVYLGCF